MSDDEIFRWVLIGGFVAIVPVAFFHRLKAATPEKLDRSEEGIPLLVSIRLLGVVGMSGLLAFMIEPTLMEWSSAPLPSPLRWTGAAIGVLAGLLLVWTFRNLGKNITDSSDEEGAFPGDDRPLSLGTASRADASNPA